MQNLLKWCKAGVSRIVCSCLIYFCFKNQFGGLISHHFHRDPWRLAGCHFQAFISAIALPWFIKMSFVLSDTLDSKDALSRAFHGTSTQCERSCFCLRPFLYFKVPYLCIWRCLLCAQVAWPLIFPRNPSMPITSSEPSHTLKLSLRREGEATRAGKRYSLYKGGNSLCGRCFCSDPSILHSALFHHLPQIQGSSTGDPDETSWPSLSPWWWPGFRIYIIQVYQGTYNSIRGLFSFSFLSLG